MTSDFLDAFNRHGDDADSLFNNGRWANADHLFGISAECGLKAVMKGLGMATGPSGDPSDRSHKVHIDRLWTVFLTFISGTHVHHYARLLGHTNAFASWDVNQRYLNQTNFNKTDTTVHKHGWSKIKHIVISAKIDGII